ncbi:MAG: YbaN family protein [Candidatus Aphodosoma sp.]
MKNQILTVCGILCVVFAVIGIFLPVLPTTPWLLLATWLFYKANPKMREWLLNNKYLGLYIYNYVKYKAIPLRMKIISISLLWVTILISVFVVNILWLRILLLCIALAVTMHLLMIKTLK